MDLRRFRFVLALLGVFLAVLFHAQGQEPSADLVVYGGTPSGVMAAYSAARSGLQVVLLEPGAHVGGMVTGGLSATDLGYFAIIGGYVRDFYMKAAAHYGVHSLDTTADWRSEPHVDEAIFRDMLKQAGVKVRFHEQLREHNGVELRGNRIVAVTTANGERWPAKAFVDCSYEGELMAQSHVSYTWGRESAQEYGEGLAGVRAHTPKHQFAWGMSAYEEDHRLLPEIDPGPLAAPGSGDKKVESYNFRMVLTDDPADRLPFTRPEGYNRAQLAMLERYLSEFQQHMGSTPRLKDFFNPVMISNHKADFNNNGPISTDYIGHSWKYPEGSYAEKAALWRENLLYTQSFVYFFSHDPSVPESLRAEMNEWGLPKDEFEDTDHWPNQLYVREARRMIGAYVMRQSDVQEERTKADSIGMGSYNIDSHNIERVAMPDGTVQNEGDIEIPVKPYEIPYRSITPKSSQVENLLVPVCLSATHIAYSSVRMESQYMILGQAAGEAAALAVRHHTSVQDISISELQQKLREHGAVLHLNEEYRTGSQPAVPR